MAGRRFTTLVTLFEPFPSQKLLAFMQEFVAGGGRLIWSGPPPLVTFEGEPARETWQDLFGCGLRAATGRRHCCSRQSWWVSKVRWPRSSPK